MAIKNFLLWLNLFVALLSGCQAIEKRRKVGEPTRPPEVSSRTGSGPVVEEEVPLESNVRPKVGVILGPGGAKAFASSQVLKAFQEQRLPIDQMIGLEWGAYIGALFSLNGEAHEVEWQGYKMLQQGLPHKKRLFGKSHPQPSINVMDDYLKSEFGKKSVTETKIPFTCPVRRIWSGLVVWQTRGSLDSALRNCLPYAPVFKVQGSSVAGASALRESVALLKKRGVGVIVYVDVLGTALPRPQSDSLENLDEVVLWQEVKHALSESEALGVDVVSVDTSSVSMVSFDSVKELQSRAYASGRKGAKRIIEKYGL